MLVLILIVGCVDEQSPTEGCGNSVDSDDEDDGDVVWCVRRVVPI